MSGKVGDGSSSGEDSEEILIDHNKVPPSSFIGKIHICIDEEPEEPDEPEEPEEPTENTSISLTMDNSYSYGEPIEVTANITPNDATGSCTFSIDTSPITSITSNIVNGSVTVSFNGIPIGDYTISCEYNGDDTYIRSTANSEFTIIE